MTQPPQALDPTEARSVFFAGLGDHITAWAKEIHWRGLSAVGL